MNINVMILDKGKLWSRRNGKTRSQSELQWNIKLNLFICVTNFQPYLGENSIIATYTVLR